jgi:hypothetical protein
MCCNCQYRIIIQTQYEFIFTIDAIQKLNSIRLPLKMTQENGRNMWRYNQQRMKTNVDTVVSISFPSDYLLCECSKLYLL